MKEIFEKNPQTDFLKPLDFSIFRKRGNSKTFGGWLIQKIKESRDQENPEMVQLLSHIYQKYNEYHERFNPKHWRGKSGVTFIEKPDIILAIRHRRDDIDEKPKEVITELSRNAINRVLQALFQLDSDKHKLIKTSEIAELTYNRAWKDIFSDRQVHIKLTEILNYLEYKDKIRYYRSGKVKLLR